MRRFIAIAILLSVSANEAAGAVITGLFNTGVNGSNVAIADSAVDPHYSIISQPTLGSPNAIAIPADGYPIGQAWVPNDSNSRWIAPATDADGDGAAGQFIYRTTFILPSNVDLTTVVINGTWSTDNEGSGILLNNGYTGQSLPFSTPFTSMHGFSITHGFVVGINTLDFVINNEGGPTGLRVDDISGTFNTVAAIVPEPASATLWCLGALGCALGAYRRRKQPSIVH